MAGGHEHHYDRSHPIRGQEKNATLTPVTAATDTAMIDTSIQVTYDDAVGSDGRLAPFESFTLKRPRRD